MSQFDRIRHSTAAQIYFEAKVREFEAACFAGDPARIADTEENCRSALAAMLDANRMLTITIIQDASRDHFRRR